MTNIAMENPNHKWRFLAGKIIYVYGPFAMAMLNNQRIHANDGKCMMINKIWGWPEIDFSGLRWLYQSGYLSNNMQLVYLLSSLEVLIIYEFNAAKVSCDYLGFSLPGKNCPMFTRGAETSVTGWNHGNLVLIPTMIWLLLFDVICPPSSYHDYRVYW